jgi:hypothetical protein
MHMHQNNKVLVIYLIVSNQNADLLPRALIYQNNHLILRITKYYFAYNLYLNYFNFHDIIVKQNCKTIVCHFGVSCNLVKTTTERCHWGLAIVVE